MRKVYTWVAALIVTAIVAGPALAQDKPRFGGGFGQFGSLMLLGQESVQKELKLSDEQVSKVKELGEKQRESFRDFQNLSREERQARTKEMEKAVTDLLKPEQAKRLKQISLQQRGGGALTDEEVQKTLNLSAEQVEKVRAIEQDGRAAMKELFQPGGDPQEGFKKMQEFRKTQNEKFLNVLTPDQKTKWKELVGEEFKGEIKPQFGRKPGKPPVG
jgi:Spy/CpxP family protein refolding chaperone